MTAQAMQAEIKKMEAELKRLQAELAKMNKTTPQYDYTDVAYLNEVYNA